MSGVLHAGRAELAAMLLGRRPWIPVAIAVVGSALAGLAVGGLLSSAAASSDLEAATAIVARGSAAQLAIVVLASLGVAAPYRDGGWMHAALAHPRPVRRLALTVVPMLVPALLLAALSSAAAVAGAAVAGAAVLERTGVGAILSATGLHLAASTAWAMWMAGLAHAARSPMLVLAVGLALPLIVEPGISGALVAAELEGLRWLMPCHALRAIAEGVVVDGAVLAPIGAEAVRLAAAAAVGWTAIAVLAAWARLGGTRPR